MNSVYGRGGLNVRRYYIWFVCPRMVVQFLTGSNHRTCRKAAQSDAQHQLWTDDQGYYFCNIVTVLPEAQGMGIGKELFGVVMRLADAEGRKCYLESSRAEPNMAIYRKMGFELTKEMKCDDQGTAITLYCMMRNPRTK
jgi:GNAT superfamily N-acetyltransferase